MAPKVLPMAISLNCVSGRDNSIRSWSSSSNEDRKHLPHASKQLNKTTITESKSNNNVGSSDVASTHVDAAQNECGKGESTQTQRSRVGKLALLNGLVQTRLELSSEGREVVLVGIGLGQRTIAKASSGLGHFVLLVGHLRGKLRSIGIFRSAVDAVIRTDILFKGCILLGRHGALYEKCQMTATNRNKSEESSWLE